MGFRSGAYATVWEVKPVTDTMTKVRISISRKNKQTNQYEDDFGGYVAFVGMNNAKNAAALLERERIKLGDVEVTTKYDREKKITYTNFTAFSFEIPNATNVTTAEEVVEATVEATDEQISDGEVPF